MNNLALAFAMTIALTLMGCGKSAETESGSFGTSSTTTEQSEQSVTDSGINQETIQSEQAAFEAADPAGENQNTDSTISEGSQ